MGQENSALDDGGDSKILCSDSKRKRKVVLNRRKHNKAVDVKRWHEALINIKL